MASISSIDELNNMQTSKDRETIKKYFEEMDLDSNEIDERVALANDIYDMYIRLFVLLTATAMVGEVIEQEYWKEYLTSGYNEIIDNHSYNADDQYISDYVEFISTEVLTTTYEHIAQTYYLSNDRAVIIACNDANSLGNYNEHVQKIKAGYTKKRWVTKRDKKVRHTHILADGQEKDIQQPFIIGSSQMMFPLDTSLDAESKELINCRCVCKYFDIKNSFNTEDDPLREVLGSALINNKDRVEEITNDLLNSNATIKYRDESMAYTPSLSGGQAGDFIICEDASIGAWEHEYKHFLDDRENGYLGFRIFTDNKRCWEMEYTAYQKEIDIAEKIGRIDIKERLILLRDKELKKYENWN